MRKKTLLFSSFLIPLFLLTSCNFNVFEQNFITEETNASNIDINPQTNFEIKYRFVYNNEIINTFVQEFEQEIVLKKADIPFEHLSEQYEIEDWYSDQELATLFSDTIEIKTNLEIFIKLNLKQKVEWSVLSAPTTTSSGYVAKKEGATIKSYTLPKLNETDYFVSKDATNCNARQIITYKIYIEGNPFTFTALGEQNSHLFNNFEIITIPTENTLGKYRRYCANCDFYEDINLPSLNNSDYLETELSQKSCTEDAISNYTYLNNFGLDYYPLSFNYIKEKAGHTLEKISESEEYYLKSDGTFFKEAVYVCSKCNEVVKKQETYVPPKLYDLHFIYSDKRNDSTFLSIPDNREIDFSNYLNMEEIEGVYIDSAYTQKVPQQMYLTNNTTLYVKIRRTYSSDNPFAPTENYIPQVYDFSNPSFNFYNLSLNTKTTDIQNHYSYFSSTGDTNITSTIDVETDKIKLSFNTFKEIAKSSTFSGSYSSVDNRTMNVNGKQSANFKDSMTITVNNKSKIIDANCQISFNENAVGYDTETISLALNGTVYYTFDYKDKDDNSFVGYLNLTFTTDAKTGKIEIKVSDFSIKASMSNLDTFNCHLENKLISTTSYQVNNIFEEGYAETFLKLNVK